ncbi:hypothetical protein [Haladaptatus halobius]|uniref:hypothetical protein n=1 Tax=Haladaptatus halobius TaxID=2884875 RepID=UPI001D0A2B4E|nr:hypothetical protein [Haladaptatus halobius]
MNEEVFGGRYEFSCEVAVELAEVLGRYDNADNQLWLVMSDPHDSGERKSMGALVTDGGHSDDMEGAPPLGHPRTRTPRSRPGHELMDRAMAFCEEAGFERMYLWNLGGYVGWHMKF